MKCPVCQTPDLLMTERQGVEIDYCPTCRGIWLDRGELDKLLSRADQQFGQAGVAGGPPQQQPYPPASPYSHQPPPPPHYRGDLDDSKYGYKYKKPKSWWHEFFD